MTSFGHCLILLLGITIIINLQVMCLTFFCLNPQQLPNVKFMIAFNRQEALNRKTLPFASFEDDPNVYGGRDQISGGTWMGINIATGIMVILTNYVDCENRVGLSRGILVSSFLSSSYLSNTPLLEYNMKIKQDLASFLAHPDKYSPCNIVIFSIKTSAIYYASNQDNMVQCQQLSSNQIHALCNTNIHKMWPKTAFGKQKMQQIVHNSHNNTCEQLMQKMLTVMKDDRDFPTHQSYAQRTIFVNPVLIESLNLVKMTKSTLLGVFYDTPNGVNAKVKEITYSQKKGEQGKQISQTNYSLFI